VIDAEGVCTYSETVEITIDSTSSTGEIEESAITIYPNPTSGVLTVKLSTIGLHQPLRVDTYNTMGQLVATTYVRAGESEAVLSLQDYASGSYIVKCYNDTYDQYFRVVRVIALLAAIFLGVGLVTPEVSYDEQVEVSKSAAESWAVMNDQSLMAQWINGYIRNELVSGTANTVGAVSNVYVDEQGKEVVMQETITAITPGEHMAMQFSMDFMNMDYEMTMTETKGKTIIDTKTTATGNGIFAKSMIAFMPKMMKAQEQENLNNLKKLIDSNTKNYFPTIHSSTVEIGTEG